MAPKIWVSQDLNSVIQLIKVHKWFKLVFGVDITNEKTKVFENCGLKR